MKRIVCIFLAIFLLLPNVVYADQKFTFTNVVDKKEDGTEGSFTLQNNGSIDINCKFNGDKNHYYTYGVYDGFSPKDFSAFNGVWISLKEKKGSEAIFNLSLTDSNNRSMVYSNEYKIVKELEGKNIVTTTNKGSIILNPYEGVKIFLPFENSDDFDYSKVVSLGINITGQGNTKVEIEAKDIAFANETFVNELKNYKNVQIKGESYVYGVTYGSVTTQQYTVEGIEKYKFNDYNLPSGVKLTEDNRLIIDSSVKPQTLYLTAEVGKEMSISYPITILNSWTVDSNADNYYIPAEDSNQLEVYNYKSLLADKKIIIVRIIVIGVFLTVGVTYIVKRRKNKK